MKPFDLELANSPKRNGMTRENMESKYFSVYMHIFPNSMVYIGMTSNSKKRWEGYGCNYKKNKPMYEDIKKYGWENVKHEIIASMLSLSEAEKLEDELIMEYQQKGLCYNISRGGIGGGHPAWNKGIPISEEQKEKLIKANKGRKQTDEAKRKIGLTSKGHIVTEETRRKIGFKNRGRVHTKEHIEKYRQSNMYRYHKVSIYKDDMYIGDYDSLYQAVKELGLNKGNAHRALTSKSHKCNGYTIIKKK